MPVSPPLTVKESDDSVTVRPANVLSFNAADFTVAGSGDTATISIDSTGTGAALTDTYIGFGNASNLLTGSANFTFTEESGGSGPSVLLTGDKPVMRFTDDTGATNYTMRFTQSGSSFYMAHEDSAGTDNGMFRISASYVALMPTIQPRVGIGGYGDSGVALTIVDDGTDTMLRLESTDVGASVAPIMELFRNSASPADGDSLGSLSWQFQDDGGGKNEAGYIKAYISDASATSEDADFYWYAMNNGSLLNMLSVRGGIRAVEVNVNEADVDFIANGDTVGELFHVDASQENCGVGGSPSSDVERLHVKGSSASPSTPLVVFESTGAGAADAPYLDLHRSVTGVANSDIGNLRFTGMDAADNKTIYARIWGEIRDADAGDETGAMIHQVLVNNVEREFLRMSGKINNVDTGYITFNECWIDMDFRIESLNESSLFHIVGSSDKIGLGNAPSGSGPLVQVRDDISYVSYTSNQNTSAVIAALRQKNGHIVCNPSGGDITVTLGAQGSIGEKITLMNTAGDASTVLFAVAVGDSTLTTPAAFSSGDSQTWFCYKDDNWILLNSQT